MYLKRFPKKHLKRQHECRGPIMGNLLRHFHSRHENTGTCIHLCEESISQGYRSPLTSALSPVSADSAASLCPVQDRCTSQVHEPANLLIKSVGTREVTVNHGVQQRQSLESWLFIFNYFKSRWFWEPSKFHYDVSLMLCPTLLFRLC